MIYKPINPFIYFPRLGSDSTEIDRRRVETRE